MARHQYKKYSNKKVVIDGITFDSMKEYNRFLELKHLEEEGIIYDLQRQVKFELIPKQVEVIEQYSAKTGKRLQDKIKVLERECTYIADFVYYTTVDNKLVVEDTKGMRTDDYIIKRKLMLYLKKIKIIET